MPYGMRLRHQYNDTGTMGNKTQYGIFRWRWFDRPRSRSSAAAEANPIHANVKEVNGLTVDGTGTEADPWGPV